MRPKKKGRFTKCQRPFLDRSNRCGLFGRPDHHDHLATFHLRHILDLADAFDFCRDPLKQVAAQFLMRHLAATEAQGDLHLIAILEEFLGIADFAFKVMIIGTRPHLDLFDLNDLLLLAGFGFALLLFIFELAEIHDLTHGRFRIRRNLDQIKTCFFGHFHGAGGRNNAYIFAICADQANFI